MLPTRARICLGAFALLAIPVLAANPATAQGTGDDGTGRTLAPANAKVFFLNVRDGATIPTKFKLRFGVSNMEIAPAGTPKANAGHHHLLIDTQDPALDRPIPADLNHLHFGKGQTEAEVILTPGEHTLQLVLGDHDHVPHNPPVKSAVIHVRVTSGPVNKSRSEAPSNAEVFFVGLADGATLPPKSVVKFGLKGMELSPAGTDKPLSGHHHLIIDDQEPALDREIPSDLNHLHFGKGQTEAEITLTPGEHTLQLVLGDYEHVPHDPPVMSKPLHVKVAEPRPEDAAGSLARTAAPSGRKPSPPDAEVYFIYPHDGEEIYANSTIRFGLKNMGVAPAGVRKEGTGHHHLLVDTDPPPAGTPIPNDLNTIHLGGGQTEKKITLTHGEHTLQLVFADDEHVSFEPPVMSRKIKVYVTRGRLSRDRVAYGRKSARY